MLRRPFFILPHGLKVRACYFSSGRVTDPELDGPTKFWSEQLRRVDRMSAMNLLGKLVSDNPLGFAGARPGKTRVVDEACAWKLRHPECILLVRLGDFYEAWGTDAVMLVQHAGLNPMGDSCRAGCPKSNIQQTINALTEAGLSVAIYEEANIAGSRSGKIKKERYLSQICTPARPVYIYDTCLREGDLPFRDTIPYAAIRCSSNNGVGCSLFLANVDAKEVKQIQNITVEAIGGILEGIGGVADPVWVSLASPSQLSKLAYMLPSRTRKISISVPESSFKSIFLNDVCSMLAIDNKGFTESSLSGGSDLRPLHSNAAQFLGVAKSSNSPDLVKHMIPSNSGFFVEKFLRSWLLCPPDSGTIACMRTMIRLACSNTDPIPSYTPLPVDKLVRLLESRNGNIFFFLDVFNCCQVFRDTPTVFREAEEMLVLTKYASGRTKRSLSELESDAKIIQQKINACMHLSPVEARGSSSSLPLALAKFIAAKEPSVFGYIKQDYALLDLCRSRLIDAVTRSVIDPEKHLKYDPITDTLHVKDGVKSIKSSGEVKRKKVPDSSKRNRDTTDLILKAETEYREAVVRATETAKQKLQALSESLSETHLKEALIMMSHWAVVLGSITAHSEHAVRSGWVIPEAGTSTTTISDFWPYWMHPTPVGCATRNSCVISSTVQILTAPNMCGKSTLIRAIGAVALLGNAGFMVPAKHATLAPYNQVLVVSPNGDRPVEGVSAFAAEADAMSIAIRDCQGGGLKTLLLVDEFGRGTSGADATALSGALLGWLGSKDNIACIWATHLHDLFRLSWKRVEWIQMQGYKLLPGKCEDSKGIATAHERGIPAEIIQAAYALKQEEVQQGETKEVCPVKRVHMKLFPMGDTELHALPAGLTPPPSAQAKPVVYVLKFEDQYYVGETENFKARLVAHTRRFKQNPDRIWYLLQTNRSKARAVETSLIQAYMKEGIQLLSHADGSHRHSVAAN